jgi:hypothetical protein
VASVFMYRKSSPSRSAGICSRTRFRAASTVKPGRSRCSSRAPPPGWRRGRWRCPEGQGGSTGRPNEGGGGSGRGTMGSRLGGGGGCPQNEQNPDTRLGPGGGLVTFVADFEHFLELDEVRGHRVRSYARFPGIFAHSPKSTPIECREKVPKRSRCARRTRYRAAPARLLAPAP